jgi:hypothetical protein
MMKKILIVILCITAVLSCKEESIQITGDFIYYKDAAVLQTTNEVYGVIINDNLKALAEQAKPLQAEETDMVKVEVKGIIVPKPEGTEGWPNNIDIKEILNVKKLNPEANDVVKLGK